MNLIGLEFVHIQKYPTRVKSTLRGATQERSITLEEFSFFKVTFVGAGKAVKEINTHVSRQLM